MQDYLECLLLIFLACKQLRLLQAMIIWFCTALDWCGLVGEDLVVECIYKGPPFPTPSVALEYRHVGYNNFNRLRCIPVSFDFVRKLDVFVSRFLVGVFPCLGADASLLAAFVCEIVRKQPSSSLKYRLSQPVVTV